MERRWGASRSLVRRAPPPLERRRGASRSLVRRAPPLWRGGEERTAVFPPRSTPSARPPCSYHFADGPVVEYIGAVPAASRESLPALLNAACAALIAADGATSVAYIDKGDARGLAGSGLTAEDCAHLPDGKPVRVVSVGGPDNPCPCGGTHVRSAQELGAVTVRAIKVAKGRTTVKYTIPGLELKA